jgi:undecaprenyl diphosphate synthase
VRVVVIGEREGLPADILPLLTEAERLTAANTGQTLVIAFNYGSRHEIASAAAKIAAKAVRGEIDPKAITPELFERHLMTVGIPDPDLVIRTSGEKRLSNFLAWQTAYSEFVFTDTLWPDFTAKEFGDAIREYCARQRRFGGTDGSRSRETGS